MASLRNGTLGLRKGVGKGKMLILESRLLDPDHRLSSGKCVELISGAALSAEVQSLVGARAEVAPLLRCSGAGTEVSSPPSRCPGPPPTPTPLPLLKLTFKCH